MTKLNEVIEANKLLVSLGGEDQMPSIAATAMEKYLELQSRIDLAVEYAKTSTSNSTHAKNMVAILHGRTPTTPEPVKVVEAPKKAPQKKAPQRRKGGLVGRSKNERQKFRQWAEEYGLEVPKAGPIPQHMIDTYDQVQEELRKARVTTPPNSNAPEREPDVQNYDGTQG